MAEDEALLRIGRELLLSSFLDDGSGLDEPWVLDRIAASIEELPSVDGEVLYRAGETAEHLFFMTEGRIRLRKEGEVDWIYEGRWAIGTTDLLARRRRARTATVEGAARIFRIPGQHWIDLMDDSLGITSDAVIGSARAVVDLRTRLAPTGGFDSETSAAAPCDTSSLVGKAVLLSGLPVLHDASVQALTDLAGAVQEHELEAGQPLFTTGSPTDRVFVVVSGEIEVWRDDPRVEGVFGPGQIPGGAVCLVGDTSPWSGVARVRSRLISFSLDEWFDEAEEHPDLARVAMAALALERERLVEKLALGQTELVLR